MSTKFHLHLLRARLGKLSNNLETHGEDDRVPGFTFPVDGEIDREQLDELMGKGFASRVFDKNGNPAAGFTNCAPLAHRWVWAKVHADLIGEEGGPSDLEFDDCRVKDLALEFHQGAMTQVHFSLYLHPGLGDANLALQRYQRCELGELVLHGGERQLKASDRQGALALGGQASAPAAGGESGASDTAGASGSASTAAGDEGDAAGLH